jgi:diaminopimelate epimerase
MDYRNADGSVAQMCGNGIRVFARYLASAGLVSPAEPLAVSTRDGVKRVSFLADGRISADLGPVTVGPAVQVEVEGRPMPAVAVDAGNPHAVAFVDSLDAPGPLLQPPRYAVGDFPEGVNVEFAVRVAPGVLAMRVFERGVGETQSCGTGACAVAAAARAEDGETDASYTVQVPGGRLTVSFDHGGAAHLAGPAELVAEGTWMA